MSKNVTPEDIEAAKHAWKQRRDEMIARHQEDVRALEADFCVIATVEGSLKAFADRFKPMPGTNTITVPTDQEVESAAGLARQLVGGMIDRDGATETPNFGRLTPIQS